MDTVPKKKRTKVTTSTPVQKPKMSQVMDLFGEDNEAEEDPGKGTSQGPVAVGAGAVHYVNGREDGRQEVMIERDNALQQVEDLEHSHHILERALQDSQNRYICTTWHSSIYK